MTTRLIVAGLCSAVALLTSHAKADEKKIAELSKARFEAAKEAYRLRLRLVKERPESPSVEGLCALSKKLLDAERDLSAKPESHLKALESHLRRMVELEKIASEQEKVGIGGADQRLVVRTYRLEAELWTEKAKLESKKK